MIGNSVPLVLFRQMICEQLFNKIISLELPYAIFSLPFGENV
jgi:hypothetical protein